MVRLIVEDGVEVSQEGIAEEVHVHSRDGRWHTLDGDVAVSLSFLEVSVWAHGDLFVTVDDEIEVFEVFDNLLAAATHVEHALVLRLASSGLGSSLEFGHKLFQEILGNSHKRCSSIHDSHLVCTTLKFFVSWYSDFINDFSIVFHAIGFRGPVVFGVALEAMFFAGNVFFFRATDLEGGSHALQPVGVLTQVE